MHGYTVLRDEQRSGVIQQAHISQISVDKPGFSGHLGSQISDDQLDDMQYTSQKEKIKSGVIMAHSHMYP